MLELSGFEFLKFMLDFFVIIVIFVYKEFVLEGYELDILDYLLKFFFFVCFFKVMNKIIGVKMFIIFILSVEKRNIYFFIKGDKKIY